MRRAAAAMVFVLAIPALGGCKRRPRTAQPEPTPPTSGADASVVASDPERIDLRVPGGGTLTCRPIGPLPDSVAEVLFACGGWNVFRVDGDRLAAVQTVNVGDRDVPAATLNQAMGQGRQLLAWFGGHLIGVGKQGLERWAGPEAAAWVPLAAMPGAVASVAMNPARDQLWLLTRAGVLLRALKPGIDGKLAFEEICKAGVIERQFGVQSALNGQVVPLDGDRIYLVLVADRALAIARVDPAHCAPKRTAIPEMPPQPVDRLPPGAVGRSSAVGFTQVGYSPPFLGAVQRLGGKLMLHRRFDLLELADDDTWLPWSLPEGVDLGRSGGGVSLPAGGFVWSTYGTQRAVICRERRCLPLAIPAGTSLAWVAAWPDGRIALYESQPRLTLVPAPAGADK